VYVYWQRSQPRLTSSIDRLDRDRQLLDSDVLRGARLYAGRSLQWRCVRIRNRAGVTVGCVRGSGTVED